MCRFVSVCTCVSRLILQCLFHVQTPPPPLFVAAIVLGGTSVALPLQSYPSTASCVSSSSTPSCSLSLTLSLPPHPTSPALLPLSCFVSLSHFSQFFRHSSSPLLRPPSLAWCLLPLTVCNEKHMCYVSVVNKQNNKKLLLPTFLH